MRGRWNRQTLSRCVRRKKTPLAEKNHGANPPSDNDGICVALSSSSPLPPTSYILPQSTGGRRRRREEGGRKEERRSDLPPSSAPHFLPSSDCVSLESNQGKMISTLLAYKEESREDSRPLWKKFFSFSREEEEGFVKGVLFFLSFSPAYLVSLGSSSSFSSGGRNFKALLFLFLSFVPPGTLGTPMRLLRRWRRRRCS